MSPRPAPSQPTDDTERHRHALNRLIDLGTNLAQAIHDQAIGPDAAGPAADAAQPFERVARTVRRTILMAQKLDTLGVHRAAARRQVLRQVEDTIGHVAKPQHAGALRAELLDRMDGLDIEFDIATRPLTEIAAEIARDFGLFNQPGFTPYQRRTPTDIAELLAAASAPVGTAASTKSGPPRAAERDTPPPRSHPPPGG